MHACIYTYVHIYMYMYMYMYMYISKPFSSRQALRVLCLTQQVGPKDDSAGIASFVLVGFWARV